MEGRYPLKKITAKCIAIILSLVFILSFTACSRAEDEDVFRVGTPAHNGLYNPLYAIAPNDKDVCNLVFESLVEVSPTGELQINRNLVKNLSVSDDGRTYTFKLTEDAHFSDGTPLTAQDVAFTYQALADPNSTAYFHENARELKGANDYMLGQAREFTSVVAVDDHRVQFIFQRESSSNMELCRLGILSKAYYSDTEIENLDLLMHSKMRSPLGSGPYVLTDYIQGEGLTLTKDPNYWNKEIDDYPIEKIKFVFLDPSDYPAAIKDEVVDFIPDIYNTDDMLEIVGQQNSLGVNIAYDLVEQAGNNYGYFGFNTQDGFAKSRNLRQIIAYGSDREQFVNYYFVNSGKRVNVPLPETSSLYSELNSGINSYDYDIGKAKDFLEEVGYRWDENGKLFLVYDQVTLKFLATVENTILNEILPRFLSDMEALGIDVEVEYYNYSELERLLKNPDTDWDIFFMEETWQTDDLSIWDTKFSTKEIGKGNLTKFSNEEVDELLQKVILEKDQYSANAKNLYKQIGVVLNEELPELPIYTRNDFMIVSNNINKLDIGYYQRWSQCLKNVTFNEDLKK